MRLACGTLLVLTGVLVSCTFGQFDANLRGKEMGHFAIIGATPGDRQVTLRWGESSWATGYTIQYGSSSGNYTITTPADTDSSHTITGLTNGSTYYFMVQATNAFGVRNANAEVSAMPIVLPGTLTATLDITNDTQWELTWPAVNGTAPITYTVARTSTYGSGYSNLPNCTNSATTTCSDSSVAANSTYCYKVTANNAGGSTTSEQICPALTTPPTLTLSTRNNIPIPTLGGAPPLNFSVESGTGTIDTSTGVYATTQSGPATIKVIDAQNTSQTITINNKKIRFDGRVRAMVQAGTSLYVGGDFTNVNVIDAPSMMVLDLNGKPKYTCDLQGGFNDKVRAVQTSGDSVYVGGYFTQYRGQSANYIAKLKLPSCELDTTFSPPGLNGFNAAVHALAVAGTSLYVGGEFTDYKSVANSARRIAKLDLNTGALDDTNFSPAGANGFNNNVDGLAVSDSSLYAGGDFTDYRGSVGSANKIAKLDLTSGALDTTFSPPGANGFDFDVNVLAVAGTSLYVGGSFTAYRGLADSANRIAKLNLNTGTLDTTFNPPTANGFNGVVSALKIADSTLYAGGSFSAYKGGTSSARRIAKLDINTGALDTTFSPPTANGFNDDVQALAVAGSSLYVGGAFTDYRGVANSANRIAKLDLTSGALDTVFSPPGANGFNNTDNIVYALAVSGTSLYVGGWFADYRGVVDSARKIAKLDLTSGALDTTFHPPGSGGFNYEPYALAVSGTSLYVGGYFTSYRGMANSAKRIAKLNLTDGTLDTAFSPPAANGFNSWVNALAISGSSLYVGGEFTDYRDSIGAANKIAKLDLNTGALDTTFSPPGANGFDLRLDAIVVSGSSLYVGGLFTAYKGVANSANYIAKLDLTSGVLDTTFSPPGANGFDGRVRSLAVSGTTLLAGGDFTTYRGSQNARYLVPLDLITGALGDP